MREQSDLAPCRLHEHEGGEHSLTFAELDAEWAAAAKVFEAKGYHWCGYAWQAVVGSRLRERTPAVLDRVGFDSELGMLCAYGTDFDALLAVAHLVAEMVSDHTVLDHAIDNAGDHMPADERLDTPGAHFT